jgi:probable DNA repair protein
LVQSAEAARNAQSAWALLRAWHLRHDHDPGASSEEVRAFRAWAIEYASLCRRNNWIDLASVVDRLTAFARGGSQCGAPAKRTAAMSAAADDRHMPRRLVLVGFDALTPQQQSLFAALGEMGLRIENGNAPSHEVNATRLGFADQDDELESAARWARQRLEDDPGATVAIVVPGLAGVRHRVAAIFAKVFTPGAARPGCAESPPQFNISLGRALAEVPVAGDALLALGAMGGQLSLPDAGRWLLSPYLGGGDLSARARFDAQLRGIGEPRYTLTRLRELAGRATGGDHDAHEGAAPLADLLDVLHSRGVSTHEGYPLFHWVVQFSSWLAHAGWPGGRGLSSNEFQAVQAFNELLATLAALTPVLPPVDFAGALSQLQRLAARQLFQPRSGSAPVQVLGVLEAAGIDYAHLWITGLHHQAWPEPARPNPFVPFKLQRQRAMPRATSEQQLQWAQAWTARMLASAPQVIVSYPRQNGEEALRPSALITQVPEASWDSISASRVPGDAEQVHDCAPALERLDDHFGPAVDVTHPVRGGVSVFKDQAACPFRAFAIHRLGASDVEAPDSSLDPRVRGNLAHRLMELLWQSLGGQARLLAMPADELEALIRDTAKRVLSHEARRRPHTLRGRLLNLEQKRLQQLAQAWLSIEAGRSAFEVQAERSESRNVAGLAITLRPDRIDRLDDGQVFLVDYKTGQCNPKDWFGERPDEPQLPVYALAMDDGSDGRVAGLAFAVLRPGELGYRGLADTDTLAPGVKSVSTSRVQGARDAADWEAHMALWQQHLSALAKAYLQGDARVDPKIPGATCRNCELQVLCRVHEQ